MDLRQVEAFLAVADELHFGRAAERLHRAQPYLSRQIAHLEQELAAKLFDRSTRAVQLTPVGRVFLPAARKIMMVVEDAIAVARSAEAGDVGVVRVGVGGLAPLTSLPTVVKLLRERRPGIELIVVGQVYSKAGFDMVADGTLDIAFVRLPDAKPGVSTRVVDNEHLVLAVSREHRLAGSASVELSALAEEGFIAYPPGGVSTLRDFTTYACMDAGFVPNIVQHGPETTSIMAMVAAGLGVSLTVTSVVSLVNHDVSFVPLAGKGYATSSAIAWNPDRLSPAAAAVLEIFERVMPTPA